MFFFNFVLSCWCYGNLIMCSLMGCPRISKECSKIIHIWFIMRTDHWARYFDKDAKYLLNFVFAWGCLVCTMWSSEGSLEIPSWNMVWQDVAQSHGAGDKTNLSYFGLFVFIHQPIISNYNHLYIVYFFSSLSCRVLMYSIASSITWEENKIISVIKNNLRKIRF